MNEILLKILVSIAIGGVIGMERQFRDKAAGFRTIILITFGTTLFTIFSMQFKGSDPARVSAGIVTGIGFLGAGVIFRNRWQVSGLTTAATIWLSAALGIGVGMGEFFWTLISAGIVLAVLWLFPILERLMGNQKEMMLYTIITKSDRDLFEKYIKLFQQNKLYISSKIRTRNETSMTITIKCFGSIKRHDNMSEALFNDNEIIEYSLE